MADAGIQVHESSCSGFCDTSDDHETLITRPRDLQDHATPSGNAMTITALLKLAGSTNELCYVDITHQVLTRPCSMSCATATGPSTWWRWEGF